MELFLIALGVLVATLALMAAAAALPGGSRASILLRGGVGPGGMALGCALGLCGVFAQPWGSTLTAHLPCGWHLPLGAGILGLDPLSRAFLLPAFGLGLVCALAGAIALRHDVSPDAAHPSSMGGHNLGGHWFFFTLLTLALALVVTARDGIFLLIAWEAMSVAPFFLIEYNDHDPQVRYASWVYLVAAHLGALCLLACFALLWCMTGSTAFADFALAPSGVGASAVFVLALLGFGAKAGLAPLHVWLPEAHPAAPSHVSAFLSGAMINAGVYGVMRVLSFFTPLSASPVWWSWLLVGVGLASAISGVLKAMEQANLKRILAYSSVENMSLLLMGTGVALMGLQQGSLPVAVLALSGVLLHMLNHAAFKSLLFLCAGEVLHSTGTLRLNLLGGLQKRLPLLGVFFAVGTASIACLPPFNGFFGEFLLVLALGHGLTLGSMEHVLGLLLTLAGMALVGGLAVATFIKVYGVVFLGEARNEVAVDLHLPPAGALLPLCLPALACVGLGLASFWIAPHLALALPPEAGRTAEALGAVATSMRGMLGKAACYGAALAGLAGLLLLWRRWLLRGDFAPTRHITWSCGFQQASPRIQYTGMSLSEPTTRLFAPLMGMRVTADLDPRLFPARASLRVFRPDQVLTRVFTPLFQGIVRLCDALKIIQQGRIHVYILYMLLTLVALLLWGLSE